MSGITVVRFPNLTSFKNDSDASENIIDFSFTTLSILNEAAGIQGRTFFNGLVFKVKSNKTNADWRLFQKDVDLGRHL